MGPRTLYTSSTISKPLPEGLKLFKCPQTYLLRIACTRYRSVLATCSRRSDFLSSISPCTRTHYHSTLEMVFSFSRGINTRLRSGNVESFLWWRRTTSISRSAAKLNMIYIHMRGQRQEQNGGNRYNGVSLPVRENLDKFRSSHSCSSY